MLIKCMYIRNESYHAKNLATVDAVKCLSGKG